MSRGIGELGPLQEHIPEWFAVVIALLTQLGDVWLLAAVLGGLYWFDTPRRDEITVVAGVWLAGMGVYKGLKELFGFPRPDQPLLNTELLPWMIQPVYEATAFATGYGFPSGHAVNTTIVYLGLAHVLAFSTQRRRFAGAAAIIATVSFSRVALGVHYLVDVVAGVAVGLALLLVAGLLVPRTAADRPTIALGFAIGCDLFFVSVSDAHPDALFILAASLGVFAGWQTIMLGRQLAALEYPSSSLQPVVARGALLIVTVAPLVIALGYFLLASPYAIGGGLGLAIAVFTTAPVVRRSEYRRRIGSVLRR